MPKQLVQVGPPSYEVPFQSTLYTVVRITFTVKRNPKSDDETHRNLRMITVEGVSRRSWRDPLNVQRGIEIANGRAQKAMKAKLEGKRVWHRITRATDLLSNG